MGGVENPQNIRPKQVASYGGFGQQVKRTEITKVPGKVPANNLL